MKNFLLLLFALAIVVVFGGKSTKTRNAQMIKLAELGFKQLQK